MDGLETLNQFGIRFFGCNFILNLVVFVKRAVIEIDRNHLSGAKAAFFQNLAFRYYNHSSFRADDEQVIGSFRITQRTQRIAVNTGNCPSAIGHSKCSGTVPRLHHAGHILIHGVVSGIDVLFILPCFGNQHQLCGRRIAARTANGFKHGIKRSGIGRTCGYNRFYIFRMIAKREAGHFYLMAFHPVFIAANSVHLTIMGKHPERLGKPPLRECIGRIALVKYRNTALKTRIVKVRVKDRKRFSEEQTFVNDRTRRQAANIKFLNLCSDDFFLDPAADEVEVLLELLDRMLLQRWSRDHDLFNFGACMLRFLADNRYINGNLPPAIDFIACLDNFRFDNGAARFLCAKVHARQEHHPNRKLSGHDPVAGIGNSIIKKSCG